MKPETNNYIWAIVLSVMVVFGWQAFFAKPQIDKQRQVLAQQRAHGEDARATGTPGSLPPQTVNAPPQGGVAPEGPAARRARRDVIAEGQRVTIDTPALQGSIALTGARLDDLSLKDYRETPDKNSPLIVLLSPPGAPAAYYVESGFVPRGSDAPTPTATTQWTKSEGNELTPTTPVTLSWDNGKGLVFTRKYAVDKDYMFTVTQGVANSGAAPVTLAAYSLIKREGTPPTSGYSVLHEGYIGYVGDAEKTQTYPGIEKEPGARSDFGGMGGWVGFTDKYWATALIPDQTQRFDAGFSEDTGRKTYLATTGDATVTVPPGGHVDVTSRVFAGAKVSKLLGRYEADGVKKFNLMIDWGTYLWWLTQPMAALLGILKHLLGNMGVAIIALTFLIKLAFFPLANRSYLSMAKMKQAQPQLAALKERFPEDKARQQQEMMKIYKAEKINPVAGCLPMLIQIPVFFALYKVLFVTIEMRQAPFALWIKDLSQPDPTNIFNLFGLLPFNPTGLLLPSPFGGTIALGHYLAIGILPLIMGFSMFLQMKMNPEPTDPVQKTMFAWMPVLFTFMLGTFPCGLVVYWTTNNTLTILQQSLIMKRAGVKNELFANLRGMFRRKAPAAVKPAKIASNRPDKESKAPAE